ncbi:fructose-bisphosphatase class II family protein [Candidatus Saccharibacteria bacterium]|nr:fructose-bisphosphatase class II family protein [Candidatus Saccharibacteria bacterium]MCL1962949.1 fructose-bisphosphatase class II family protein [Candidatus Saccharibacteria bacterium]MCL1963403.1 fructose-bisphosphatase class II family protein [Candidatus Saccharibacteria bacterium]
MKNYEFFTRATEFAAILSAMYRGHGDKLSADRAAVYAFKSIFGEINMRGRVVSTEGGLDQSHKLEYGELVGRDIDSPNAVECDIAIDPLENTTACASGDNGAITVLAVSERDGLLYAEETYMWKIAVGPAARGKIDLTKSVTENIMNVAKALGKKPSQMTIAILDRPRHKEIVQEIRATGAMVMLLKAGDVMASIATCVDGGGVDMLIGAGKGPEGVITAAAIKCLGGDFQARLDKKLTEEIIGRKLTFKVAGGVLKMDDIVKKKVHVVSITAVTNAYFLKGVYYRKGRAITNSFVIRNDGATTAMSTYSRDITHHDWYKYIKADPEIYRLFCQKS